MSFESLGLSDALLKAIEKKGYTIPSPIQEKAIPPILEGKDVLASAQTGTGKTAGFTLPILQLLAQDKPFRKRPIRTLILTPTRELAAQILDNVRAYSTYMDLRSMVVFGGVNANPQIKALRNGVDVLVATPGRLLDLHERRALSLSKVEILVLDEADRMLDMGFQRDINKILALLPKKRQNLLFSATFSKEIKKLANGILHHPVSVEAAPENSTAEMVDQKIYKVDKAKKSTVVIKLISDGNWKQVLIFTRTKHGANRLSEKLSKNGITSAAIHGNKSQGARTKALSGFKQNKIRVLVATDIAARGLDIPLLPHVINYELPNIAEDYVHRIGRTGRAGASGEAISLVSQEEVSYVKGIEKLLGLTLNKEVIEGFEPSFVFDYNAAPPKKNQNSFKPKRNNRNYNRRRKNRS
ncbi:DEAD/DEAH box helicase [Aquimarina sp. MMG015]|uniref:DEAD/DEAH box helicase n=1 Tax=unclassified Aquimarina TaxID=2627091 RepID=UPI000E4F647D|nr:MULTISPECIES: DEAD/DEAH box helicase [unclassified Aquimarina]AXT54928.1 ATP-dependent RNA helicase RhlE [Aquimarina sp. AD1]MBQ4801875.1 DEAD/DEAH box helicase [Aquimarina sp. MMG015]RKN32503.1 DEAD/DEAH box helicase [Aquimarina sp. AD1]